MKLGIMQPYLFPYIGYFQLINAVDSFVIYDDVQYIKGGWINRNCILNSGQSCYFSFRVKKGSTFSKINERVLTEWLSIDIKKFLKALEISYHRAPFYEQAIEAIRQAVDFDEVNVAAFVTHTLGTICNYLNIRTKFIVSSEMSIPDGLRSQDRVIWINQALGADEYINAAGGRDLYDYETFASYGIKLRFIQPAPHEYKQFKHEFVPNLSIIDVMMFNSQEEIGQMLTEYSLG